ncbi:hypothetical protein N7451_012831 [Penicillium sp. IBT 35674x]|nr:hypothetical protein N7451_012831 [Penicillium sp. IBT 35674x]
MRRIASPESMSHPVSKFAQWLAGTSVQDKFGLCGLLAMICWISYSLGRRFGHLPFRLHHAVSWRRFFRAPTPTVVQWLDIPSYLQGGVLAALMIANIIAISLHIQNWADVQKRAGCLAVTHLVPLCSGSSIDLPAHVYRVERRTFQWAHRWLGRICVLHCLIHGSVLGTVARNTALGTSLIIPLLAQQWYEAAIRNQAQADHDPRSSPQLQQSPSRQRQRSTDSQLAEPDNTQRPTSDADNDSPPHSMTTPSRSMGPYVTAATLRANSVPWHVSPTQPAILSCITNILAGLQGLHVHQVSRCDEISDIHCLFCLSDDEDHAHESVVLRCTECRALSHLACMEEWLAKRDSGFEISCCAW